MAWQAIIGTNTDRFTDAFIIYAARGGGWGGGGGGGVVVVRVNIMIVQ